MLLAKSAKRIECLDHTGTARPAASDSRRQRDDAHLSSLQSLRSGPNRLVVRVTPRILDVVRTHILDANRCRKPVLSEADSTRPQVGSNRFVLLAIEPVLREQLRKSQLVLGFIVSGWDKVRHRSVERSLETLVLPRRTAEELELLTVRGPQRLRILPNPNRNHPLVIPRWQQRIPPLEQNRARTVRVDRELVDDRLHAERHRMLEAPFRFGHRRLKFILGSVPHLRVEEETHPAARHSPEHAEPPKVVAESFSSRCDQRLRVMVRRPRNDRLQGAGEIIHRRARQLAKRCRAQSTRRRNRTLPPHRRARPTRLRTVASTSL